MEWYVFGDLLFLADIVNGMAAMTASLGTNAMNDYEGFLKIATMIGIAVMLVQGLGSGMRQPATRLVMVIVFGAMMLVPKVTVTMENVYTGATRTIAGVPYGIAFTGQLFSFMGLRLTEMVETAYSFPGVTDDGLNKALDDWRTLRRIAADPSLYAAANTAGGGDFARSWVEYISTCTAFGLDVGNLQTTQLELGNLVQTAVYNPSRSFGALVYVGGGVASNLDCVDAHAALLNYARLTFLPAFKASVLAQQFYDPVRDGTAAGPATPAYALVEPKLTSMFNVLGGLGAVSIDDALISVLVGALYDHGAMRRLQLDRKDAYAVMLGDAIRARNAQWIAQGNVFQTYVKPLLSFIEGFWYALFPLIVTTLLLGPSGLSVLMRFLQIGLWIQLWGPCIAVVNLFVYHTVVGDLSNLDASALTLTSLGGQFAADSVVQQYLGVAGLFASTVPALALLLVTGSVYTMNTIAGAVGGPDTITETNAAPARQQLAPVISVAPAFEDTPMHGLMRTGAPAQMPRLDLRAHAEKRLSSAESELAGARTTYAQAIERTLSRQTGSDRESSSSSLWSNSVSARNSDVYGHATSDSFRSTMDDMRRHGVSDTEAASFTASIGAGIAAGLPRGRVINGALDGKAAEEWRTQNQVSAEKTKQWATAIARGYSEDESLQASLMTSFSNDQQRGWRQSGYTRDSLATNKSLREEGQDYAGAEQRFEEAASFSASVGTSASPDVAMLARRIVDDPSRFSDFRRMIGDNDLVRSATQRAQELHAWGWKADSADSQRMALVAGGLLALADSGNYEGLQRAVGPDGFGVANPGDAEAYRGVGDSLGAGPSVTLPSRFGGPAPESAPFDVQQKHQENVVAGRAAIDAEVGPVVQENLERERAAAETDAKAGRESPSFLQTLDGRVADRLGLGGMSERLEGRYRQEALASGLSEPEANYYAWLRANPVADDPGDREKEVALGQAVAGQFTDVPEAGRAQLAQIQEAAVASEQRREQLFGQIVDRTERVAPGEDQGELDLVRRNMR
jgi:conjugal transfer mating pair stabilization protein TraG